MLMNTVLALLIFGYAGWALIRYARKTKQGKCAACSLNQSCKTACSEDAWTQDTGHKSI